jgi:hypothetical protein
MSSPDLPKRNTKRRNGSGHKKVEFEGTRHTWIEWEQPCGVSASPLMASIKIKSPDEFDGGRGGGGEVWDNRNRAMFAALRAPSEGRRTCSGRLPRAEGTRLFMVACGGTTSPTNCALYARRCSRRPRPETVCGFVASPGLLAPLVFEIALFDLLLQEGRRVRGCYIVALETLGKA